jgi:hypothetical protein
MRKRTWLTFLFTATFALSLSASFKKEDVKVQQLENGLKVRSEEHTSELQSPAN